MKTFAPLVLAFFALTLFLLLMGSNDAALLGRGAFFKLAPPFVLLYGLCAISLKKHRKVNDIVSYAALLVLVMVPALRLVALFYESLLTLSPRIGGRYLFLLAAIDIVVGYYAPWRYLRRRKLKNVQPKGPI